MSLGRTPPERDAARSPRAYCEGRLSSTSIYRLLHDEGAHLFPDEAFADLFQDVGRRSIPPRIVAVVMVLQRLEGLSDRDAVDRFSYDLRWKYAAGGLDFEHPGFVHTVLVEMRERLRYSQDPDRVFNKVLEVAKAAALVGRRRVLDSTALYDAVATQDTVTMIRAAIRGLLRVAEEPLAAELRSVLKRDDDYSTAGKPVCDWDDAAAREELVDALACDAYALLAQLDGRRLEAKVSDAAKLLATVVGQDLELTEDGPFRIARRVAPDRVISTVDPEARHGHKTSARGFDGYKGHIAVDPDSEIITASTVTAANVGDGSVANELLAEVLPPADADDGRAQSGDEAASVEPADAAQAVPSEPVEVYGDASYGTAEVLKHLDAAGAVANVKVQPCVPPGGMFSKNDFRIDLNNDTVTCPNGVLVQIRRSKDGSGWAEFGASCKQCPLASSCTKSKEGRTITVHKDEPLLQRARATQRDPAWRTNYRATRPKVERKIAHVMRRRHGGRRACVRGLERLARSFSLLCASVNLNRLAALGWRHDAPVAPACAA
jgi:Transposase DDE domain/Transposase domain (DUF772)